MHKLRVISKSKPTPTKDSAEEIDFGNEARREVECQLVLAMCVFLVENFV